MQFIESIKILDGKVYFADMHLQRINHTLAQHYPTHIAWTALPILAAMLTHKGLYKCRIIYDNTSHTIEIKKYKRKKISSVVIIEADIKYNYKYEDRKLINHYKGTVDADCEIIFSKNGLLTDATYSNVCLWNGKEWHTPLHPELNGVMRQSLLATQKIVAKNIAANDLKKYKKISFINALNSLDELVLEITPRNRFD